MLLNSFEYDDVGYFVRNYDFEGIEPFTMLLIRKLVIFVLKWDGVITSLSQVED